MNFQNFKCTIVMLSFVAFNSCAILEEKQGAWVRGYFISNKQYCARTHTHMRMHTHVYIHIHKHTHMYMCTHTHM